MLVVSQPLPIEFGPANGQGLRPPTISGVCNGRVESSIECPRSVWVVKINNKQVVGGRGVPDEFRYISPHSPATVGEAAVDAPLAPVERSEQQTQLSSQVSCPKKATVPRLLSAPLKV